MQTVWVFLTQESSPDFETGLVSILGAAPQQEFWGKMLSPRWKVVTVGEGQIIDTVEALWLWRGLLCMSAPLVSLAVMPSQA